MPYSKKIVVLMSSYNGEKYIEEQIHSIFKQEGKYEIELIIRDDGSQDETVNIIKKLAHIYDIKLIRDGKNMGPAYSFMELLKESPIADYYAFVDQDDIWYECKLNTLINEMSINQIPKLCFSNATLIDDNNGEIGMVYKAIPSVDLLSVACGGGILGCTIMFNYALASYFIDREIPEKIIMHDMYVSIVCKAIGGEIAYINCPTVKYRQHHSNVVGVDYKLLKKIKDRLLYPFESQNISIADQAANILKIYNKEIPETEKKELKLIAEYRHSFFERMKLVFTKRTKYLSKSIAYRNRMAILFGNK